MTESKTDARTVELLELEGIMRTVTGRRVLYNILTSTGYFNDTFDKDPYTHSMRAGMRKVGINFVSLLNAANPDLYVKLIQENTNG